MVLVDDLQFNYFEDNCHAPNVGGMVTFLCGCPELRRKEKTITIFRLKCLSIVHFPPVLPGVKIRSAVSPLSGPELSEVVEPVQS